MGLYDQGTKEPVPVLDGGGRPSDGRVLKPVLVSRPDEEPLAATLDARFEDEVALTAATVGDDGGVTAGAPLRLTLRWRALRTPAADYTLFAHLVRDGRLLAQFDGQPFDGALPTSAWPPGHDIDTELAIPVPADSPPGPVQVLVGLYELASGRRLPVTGMDAGEPADHVVLPAEVR